MTKLILLVFPLVLFSACIQQYPNNPRDVVKSYLAAEISGDFETAKLYLPNITRGEFDGRVDYLKQDYVALLNPTPESMVGNATITNDVAKIPISYAPGAGVGAMILSGIATLRRMNGEWVITEIHVSLWHADPIFQPKSLCGDEPCPIYESPGPPFPTLENVSEALARRANHHQHEIVVSDEKIEFTDGGRYLTIFFFKIPDKRISLECGSQFASGCRFDDTVSYLTITRNFNASLYACCGEKSCKVSIGLTDNLCPK
ncbi:hypothetical protein HYS54_02620 [Candidatus Micrarchaeota archaeon]|nr:hypothetical protein [Candidatus Micrarchaeota archaeon]